MSFLFHFCCNEANTPLIAKMALDFVFKVDRLEKIMICFNSVNLVSQETYEPFWYSFIEEFQLKRPSFVIDILKTSILDLDFVISGAYFAMKTFYQITLTWWKIYEQLPNT